MFSVQTKERSGRFQISPVRGRFWKAPFLTDQCGRVEIKLRFKFLRHSVEGGLKINECTNSETRARKNYSHAPENNEAS